MQPQRRLLEVGDLEPGHHACCIFSSDQEHKSVIERFMERGLRRGERVVYIADDDVTGVAVDHLDAAALKSRVSAGEDQLVLLRSSEIYLEGGAFDPDRMIGFLRHETDKALAAGYSALRITGEMAWALRGFSGTERLMEYEGRLNEILPSLRCLALCQYDRRLFASDFLLDVLLTHPLVLIGDKVYHNHYHLPMHVLQGDDLADKRLEHWISVLDELKREEAELITAIRAHSVLSACSQALVRAKDEGSFMSAICRILVETGGYRLAWVGFAEHDGRRTVRPVAEAGFEEGYLGTLDVTWADEERGRGPTGTAIREGRPVSSRHIMTDPNFVPWRGEAIKRGYASSIALPLKAKSTMFGALNVYAPWADAFDERETTLLMGLADDLAFGIQALRAKNERETVIEALALSEARYRDLVENSGDLVMTHSLDGTLLSVNKAILSLLGYADAGELVGKNLREFIVPEARHELDLYMERIREVGKAEGLLSLVTRSGDACIIEYNNTLRTEGVDIPVVRAMARDITERHAAQQALHESEIRYRSLFERNLAGVFRATLDGRMVECNSALATILGYEVSSTLMGITADMHFEDIEEFHALLEKLGREPSLTNLELRLKRRDGTRLWALANAALCEDPVSGQVLIEGTLIDITQRKKSEEERLLLSTAIGQAGEAVLVTDNEGRILYANPSMEKLSGYERHELLGKNPRIMKSGAMPVRFYADLWDTILSGQVWSGRITNQRKDGSQYTAHMIISPVRDDRGPIKAFVCTLRDLTQEMAMEERLRLSRQLETIGMIAGGVAHEVRNPLFAISSLSAALERKAENPALRKELLRQIKAQSDNLNALMKDLLTLGGTIRADKFSALDLKDILPESLSRLDQSVPQAAASFSLSMCTRPLPVRGDLDKLAQVFVNLFSNALHFTPSGKKVEVTAEMRDGQAVVAVSDPGPGIPKPLLPKIFQPFQSERKGGTGLGLAIVQRIVEAHGGTVHAANNDPAPGATFTVRLPIHSA